MASKNTRSAQPATAVKSSALRLEVERLIQKERYKDAVKQAKLCFKEEGTPENHRLLERAYFLRARQLLQLGMPASAVEVAQHLLDFGVTANDWVDEFVRLLMSLGLSPKAFQIQERLGRPELKDELAELAADQAVIHPDLGFLERPSRGRRQIALGALVRRSNRHRSLELLCSYHSRLVSRPPSFKNPFRRRIQASPCPARAKRARCQVQTRAKPGAPVVAKSSMPGRSPGIRERAINGALSVPRFWDV